MTTNYFHTIVFLTLACLFSIAARPAEEQTLDDRRTSVVMRKIGHEILSCLGDQESRVLPIEKNDEQYSISFESEFEFDPVDIISTVDQVMSETYISRHYLIEVVQCNTQEIVHSFEVLNQINPLQLACAGRVLSEDCYSVLINILEGSSPSLPQISQLAASQSSTLHPFRTFFFILLALILFVLSAFYFRKKQRLTTHHLSMDVNPDLVMIGGTRFDIKLMSLSFEDQRVGLSNKESELLSLLYASVNATVKREVILQKVWGDEGDYVGRTLDVFISKLRKKIQADNSLKIINIRGVGYRLVIDTQG